MQTLKQLIGTGAFGEAWQRIETLARTTTDCTAYFDLCRAHRKLRAAAGNPRTNRSIRVALLGGANTEFLDEPLTLALNAQRLDGEFYCGGFNTIAVEILGDESATVTFAPDVAVLVITAANVPEWPAPHEALEETCARAERVCHYWLDLCARLNERARCEIIINNFHPATVRPLGNLGAKTPWDPSVFLRRVNMLLADRAPSYVHINDVEYLSGQLGVRRWFDPRYWYHAKQPVSFDCLVPYVNNTARMIAALFIAPAKCLVLDLDNTLWGGVVGDDGVDGIVVGEGNPVGEAFKAFQEYVFKLKERGVLLAVCSKNDEANALEPFLRHPGMVLKRDDFVAFVANWEPKPDNLVRIASALNIGVDALVFVDDNPAEREHIRQRLPAVKVLDINDDPATYAQALDDAGYFEVRDISSEDRDRTRQYHANLERDRLRESAGDYTAYLQTLAQKAVVRPFDALSLDRVTQLINKSNQFNVTTLRLSRAQVAERMERADYVTSYVRLADRFGDNGLISVLTALQEDADLRIELWVMSCRVLKRGVEELLCNELVRRACELGVRHIHGSYRPTEKNGLVRELFSRLGFSRVRDTTDGGTDWVLNVADHQPFPVAIQTVEDY